MSRCVTCGRCDEQENSELSILHVQIKNRVNEVVTLKAKLAEVEANWKLKMDLANLAFEQSQEKLRTIEAQAGEMRGIIKDLLTGWHSEVTGISPDAIASKLCMKIFSLDAGKGYLSPAEVEQLVREARAEVFEEASKRAFREEGVGAWALERARREREGQ